MRAAAALALLLAAGCSGPPPPALQAVSAINPLCVAFCYGAVETVGAGGSGVLTETWGGVPHDI